MSNVCIRTLIVAALLAPAGPVVAEQQTDALDAARADFVARADPDRSRAAVDGFLRIAEADPQAYDARWEGARAVYFHAVYIMEDAPKAKRLELLQTGIDRCEEAVELRPDGVEGHFWLGVLYGTYGETKGILKSLSLVKPMRRQMERCLELDRSVEGWGPDRALGRMYFKLPWFKGGDNDKSIEHLERSLEGVPTSALTRYYLADVYRSKKRKAEAIEQLRYILEMTPDPRWVPEHPRIVRDAEKLLRKLE